MNPKRVWGMLVWDMGDAGESRDSTSASLLMVTLARASQDWY